MKIVSKLILIVLILVVSGNTFANPDPSKPFSLKNYKSDWKFKSDYEKALKEHNLKAGKPIDFYLDMQVGVSSTKPNITMQAGETPYEEKAKLGYTLGALAYIKLFDIVNFTTGVSFDGKSFGVQSPKLGTKAISDSTVTNYVPANYFVIPLFVNIGGMVSEKVGLAFTGGPYFGILMSKPENTYNNIGYKNFDLGLSGTLTGNYVFMYPLSVIVGTTFKYGGLNNLMSANKIEKVTTTNFAFFTGLRFAL